jgi:hypothetical protein
VLVAHAYHRDEIERIRFSHLHDMVREAFDSMMRKKLAAPAIERSISGWPENSFRPEDRAVELRFLLGFALKRLDDPFYHVPEKEAAADRYFEARAARFRQWAKKAAPLVKRCLGANEAGTEIDFLYQDLFHGGMERGIAEQHMLRMLAEVHQALQAHGIAAERARAVVGPVEIDDETVLRVNLYAQDGDALIVSAEKPVGAGQDSRIEAEDACDALKSIGVTALSLAARFDEEGHAINVRPYRN